MEPNRITLNSYYLQKMNLIIHSRIKMNLICFVEKKSLSSAIKEPFNKFIVPFLTEIYYRPTFNEKIKNRRSKRWKKRFFELSYHSIQRSVHSSMTSRPSWLAQWCGKKAKKCFVRRNKFDVITVSDYYSYILKQ